MFSVKVKKCTLDMYHDFFGRTMETSSFVVDRFGIIYLIQKQSIWKLDQKSLDEYCGSAESPGDEVGNRLDARFQHPSCLTLDQTRRILYVFDGGNKKIKLVNMNNELVSILVVEGNEMVLNDQVHLLMDNESNLYISEATSGCIKKVHPDGTMITIIHHRIVPTMSMIDPVTKEIWLAKQRYLCSFTLKSDSTYQELGRKVPMLGRYLQIAFGLQSRFAITVSSLWLKHKRNFSSEDWVPASQKGVFQPEILPKYRLHSWKTGENYDVPYYLKPYTPTGQQIFPGDLPKKFGYAAKDATTEIFSSTTDIWGNVYFMTTAAVLMLRDNAPWHVVKLLWIGNLKEEASWCRLKWLPKEILREIIGFLQPNA